MLRRLLLLVAPLCAVRCSALLAQVPPIDTLAIRGHTYFLAHDVLRGRATGSDGSRVASAYLAGQCIGLGLRPVGTEYELPVPLTQAEIAPTTSLAISNVRGAVEFSMPFDFVPNVGARGTFVDFAGSTVFVGSEQGITSGALGATVLRGKVAVTSGPARGAAIDTLVARGATALIHLIAQPEEYARFVRSRGPSRLYHREPGIRSSFLPPLPSVLAGPRLSEALLADARVDGSGSVPPQPLGWMVQYRIAVHEAPVDDANVACLLSGADPQARDSAIALTAHFDHLGVSVPDAAGDSIYNGFSDNAAGVGMVLAIADALVRRAGGPPRHSVLLIFFGGEERGLLGSDYYVARPPWPLARITAVINLDAAPPPGLPVSWGLAGVGSSGLGAIAARVAADAGWTVQTSQAYPNSDYFPFHRNGVPAVFVMPQGSGAYEGLSAEASQALRGRWGRYHEASDHWSADFPFAGSGRYADYALRILLALDRAGVTPSDRP